MKRTLMQAAFLATGLSVAGMTAVEGQLPSPAQPADELPNLTVPQPSSEPPIVAIVESILAGEDDPVAWAALEVALGEDGEASSGDAAAAGRAETGIWMSMVALARGSGTSVTWTPELWLALGVVGLLAVAGAGALVGAFRRRRVPQRSPMDHRRRLLRSGRRRSSRGAGAACRDAARLEARLKHRRAA